MQNFYVLQFSNTTAVCWWSWKSAQNSRPVVLGFIRFHTGPISSL